MDKKGNRNWVKLCSNRKYISVAFFHAVHTMDRLQQEQKCISICEKGMIKKYYEISTTYLQDNKLHLQLKDKAWNVQLFRESKNKRCVKAALRIE